MSFALGLIIEAMVQPHSKQLNELGVAIGKLYTDKGFPVDFALDRLEYTKQQKISILDGACEWLIEHRRNSGAGESAIDRQRKANRNMLEAFTKKGETGVY